MMEKGITHTTMGLLMGAMLFSAWTVDAADAPGAAASTPATSELSPFLGETDAGEASAASGVGSSVAAGSGAGRYGDTIANALCWDSGNFSGPEGRLWFRADYLIYWTKGQRVPALATTSPAGTPQDAAGVLGYPGTDVLFGNERVSVGAHEGVQFTLGGWLDEGHCWGIQGDYFDLQQETAGFHSGLLAGESILARPFSDVDFQDVPASQLVAYPLDANNPGVALTGILDVDLSTYFQSAGLQLRRNLWSEDWGCGSGSRGCGMQPNGFRLDAIGGYRLYRLLDRLTVHQQSVLLSPETGLWLDQTDMFKTVNQFQGADLGLVANIYRGRWSFEFMAKMALGGNHRIATIRGATVVDGSPADPAGLLTQASNIGHYSRNQFTVIPEFGTEIGYELLPNVRTFVGYNILYWNEVARAGEQVDLNVSLDQTTAQPAFAFRESSFWAQGIRLGAEVRF